MIDNDISTNPPIFSMCKTGDLAGIRLLLAQDTTNQLLKSTDSHGNSLLYYACLCGRIAVVKYLSDLGLRDDQYRRCYWNSLSLQTRSILKLYNDYKNMPTGNFTAFNQQEISVSALMQQYVMKCIHTSQQDLDSDQLTESTSGEDMILKIKFKDCEVPTEYKCQSWIILSRWPQIVLFLTMRKIELDPKPELFTDKLEMTLCKMSNSDFEGYVKANNKGMEQKALYKKMKLEKAKLKVLKAKYKIFNVPTLESCNDALGNENLESFVKSKLSKVDFGFVEAKKEHFDMILTYLYTGKIPNDRYNQIYLAEVGIQFKMKKLVDYLYSVFSGASDTTQEELLLKDLDPINYLFKNDIEKISKIDFLKKNSCNMGITLANEQIDKVIICHKNIAMARCEFFQVLGSCRFEEGLKFQQQESNHELPIIELQQFSTVPILQDLLRYIYCEKVDMTKSNVVELMNISDLYGLSSLSNKCEEYLCDNVKSTGNVYEHYKLSIELGKYRWQRSLEPKALEHIVNEVKKGKMKQSEILQDLEPFDLSPDIIQRFKNASN